MRTGRRTVAVAARRAIHGVLARTAAAMAPPAAVQRKAIRRTVIAIVVPALAVRTGIRSTIQVLAVLRIRLVLRLPASDERRQPLNVLIIRHLLRTRLKMLRLLRLILRLMLRLLRLMLLRLMLVVMLLRLVLLLARIIRLRLRRIGFTAHSRLVIAIVVTVVGRVTAHAAARLLLLKIRLALAKLFLRGGDQAEIMLGMLIIIFGGNRVSGALRIAG